MSKGPKSLTSHLAGSLSTIVGTGFGSLGHNLLSGLGLKIDKGNVGVLKTNSLHGLDVGTSVALELGKGWVHVLEVLELLELLLGATLDVSLLGLDDDSPLDTVLLVKVLVEEHTTIGDEGGVDGGGEEEEGEDTLP